MNTHGVEYALVLGAGGSGKRLLNPKWKTENLIYQVYEVPKF